MEIEIAEFSEREKNISLIRKWWRSNPAFSTIDEDIVFENLLNNDFDNLVSFMGFSQHMGANPKQLVVSMIAHNNYTRLLNFSSTSDEDDEPSMKSMFINSFLEVVKDDSEKRSQDYTKTRERILTAIKIIFTSGV